MLAAVLLLFSLTTCASPTGSTNVSRTSIMINGIFACESKLTRGCTCATMIRSFFLCLRRPNNKKVPFGHPIHFSLMASPPHLLLHCCLFAGPLSLSVVPFAHYGPSVFSARLTPQNLYQW